MKTLRFTMLALGALLFVSTVKAQTNVVANIPFDFVVGKQSLPAGNYTLTRMSQGSDVLKIRNNDQTETKMVLAQATQKLNPSEKTVLIFHHFGDQYFLSEIWVEGNSRGESIPKSPIETQMAMNHQTSQQVIVAALIK